MRMDIKLLGALKATIADTPCIPSATKPRQIFALLAVNSGRVVTMSEISDELWGEDPPRSATTTLHTYIRHLRKKLDTVTNNDSTSKNLLVTEHGGYRLNIDPDQIDAGRYNQLATTGRRAAASGDHVTAAEKLNAALKLWRGPALADVEIGSQLSIEKAWLEESRLGDLELRLDMDLRLGRHHRLLGELAALCARYPMLEGFHAQYMLALYRSGRQWRALEIYQRLRNVLVNQLGIDPTPRLQNLHHAILSGNTALEPKPTTNTWLPTDHPTALSAAVPQQLSS
jgi:SARP family transcriptional regulator, regulator of embCAB operon